MELPVHHGLPGCASRRDDAAVGGHGSGTPLGHPPLVGREQELDVLSGLLGEAASGLARVVVLEGPAGIGKSRLMAALRQQARAAGFTVLHAAGSDLEREFPFGLVRQLFEPLTSPWRRGSELFAGAADAARVVVAPEEDVEEDRGSGGPYAALHALYWLTSNLAERGPLLIAVDDLHWCDRPSLRFLVYLCRRLEGMGILIALALRDAEPGTDPAMVAGLAGADDAVTLRPLPLSDDAVAELVHTKLRDHSDPEFTAACREATGGNPLLVDRLLGVLRDASVSPTAAEVPAVRRVGARAVSRIVLARLSGLSEDARAVARAVAVLGDGTPLPLVAGLTGLSEPRVAAVTAELSRVEIFRTDPQVGFVHPLIRDAVYHGHSPGERELAHRRAARLLAARHGPVDEVASHLLATSPRGDRWVVGILEQAARSARRRGALESAVALLERARAEPPPPDDLARVLCAIGSAAAPVDGPLAARTLAEAESLLSDPHQRADAALVHAQSLLFTRPPEEAVEVARRAARGLPSDLTDRRLALDAMTLLGLTTFGADDDAVTGGVGEPQPDRTQPRADGRDGPGQAMLAAVSAWQRSLTGSGAAECASEALAALGSGVLLEGDCLFAASAVTVLVLAERDEALAWLDAIEGEGHRRGSHFAVNAALLFRGRAQLARGELEDAEVTLRKAADLAVLWGGDASWEVPELAGVLLARGDPAAAGARLDSVRPLSPYSDAANASRRVRVEALLALGHHAEALVAADDLAAHLREITNPAFAPWRSLRGLALHGLGRTEEAVELTREELPYAERWGAPSALARTMRVLGTLERDVDRLFGAVEVLEGSPARLERARALHALGATVRRVRRPAEARTLLAEALELSDLCGARLLSEQIRAELYAAGGRPRVTALAGPDSLTASELRVAELAAGGRTNKEIAQALFVTVKTVEAHLSRVYRKLGVSTRRDLASRLPG